MKTKKEGIIFVVLALIILIALIILMGLDIPLWAIFLDLVCIGLGISMILDEKKAVNTKTREEEYAILQSRDEEKIKEYYNKKYANRKIVEEELPEELKQKIEENKDLFKDSNCIF